MLPSHPQMAQLGQHARLHLLRLALNLVRPVLELLAVVAVEQVHLTAQTLVLVVLVVLAIAVSMLGKRIQNEIHDY